VLSARCAGRRRRGSDAGVVEEEQQRLAVDPLETDVGEPGGEVLGRTVDDPGADRIGHTGDDPRHQVVTQGTDTFDLGAATGVALDGGRRHGDDAGHVERAAPTLALLPSTGPTGKFFRDRKPIPW